MIRLLTLALLWSMLALPPVVAAQSKGGGSTSPPLPAYRYQIQYWTVPSGSSSRFISDMNNLGQIVGWYVDEFGQNRGYLYRPEIDPRQAIDLNSLIPLPEGSEDWRIASAVGISDSGLLVGYMVPASEAWGDIRRGFVVDLNAPTLTMTLLPDLGYATSYPRRINDIGDVLGMYRLDNGNYGAYFYNILTPEHFVDFGRVAVGYGLELNNPTADHDTQVILMAQDSNGPHSPAIWSPSSGFTLLPGTNTLVHAINDQGVVCGETTIQGDSRRRTKRVPFRYSGSLQVLSNISGTAYDINQQGDLIIGSSIYQDAWGLMSIEVLVDTSDPDYSIWSQLRNHGVERLSDRATADGLGLVAGRSTDGRNYLLIPVARP